jgi:hypothetical protein
MVVPTAKHDKTRTTMMMNVHDDQDAYETISVDPEHTSITNLESAAFRWGYEVDIFDVGPYHGHTYLYGVDGRDAYDFVIRWALETASTADETTEDDA